MISHQLLPNLIIAGVNKAGTTSLFSYLSLHPDICASRKKETCYFLPLRYGRELPSINQYSQHFRHCRNQKYIMESTPGYFYGGAAVAKAIKRKLGHVRIILSFREPVSRLLSFYKSQKSMMQLDPNVTLDEYIQMCINMPSVERSKQENNPYWGIEGGFYIDNLPAWFDVFGDSIKVIFFDQLQYDRSQLVRDLCTWLNIDTNSLNNVDLETENISINYKNKFLHKFGRFINTKGERFWRRNHHIKRIVRNLYRSLNAKPFDDNYPEQTLIYLETLFRPYNQRLATELSKRGYKNLPIWLDGEVKKGSSVAVNGENINGIEQIK